MSTDPFPETAPDFSDPIGLLVACHDRIEHHCDLLERMCETWRQDGPGKEVHAAAGKAARYFSTAGKLHHEDEEKDFFPILMHQSLKLADSMHRLIRQHRTLDAAWDELEPLLRRPASIEDEQDFFAKVGEFCRLMREHLKLETEDFLSMAPHILSTRQLETIGDAMAARRGVRRA